MNILKLLLNTIKPAAKAFEESTKDPIKAQRRALLNYIRRNKNTEYGRLYAFSRIRSIEDFRTLVPIIDYESIRALVERMANGERNILTADKVDFFGITSGTTGKPKLIPATAYSRQKKSELMKLWAYYIYKDHPKSVDSKILAIISPEIKSYTDGGIPYGPEDGHAYNNLPGIIKRMYVLPYPVFYIKDYDARYYTILRISAGHDITTIATLNPSTIVLLCHRIERVQDDIIKDIAAGTLKKDLDIEPELRSAIEKTLKPNPKRAEQLQKLRDQGKNLYPKYIWPNLELVECWKGGTVRLYIKELPQYLGPVPFRDFGCLSTEARSAIPLSDEGEGSVLAINTNFYEFVPREEMGKPEAKTLLCDQLEMGKEYYIIVTTAGGLYRYNIDDIIKVTGFFNKTPVIEFVQKGQNAVSLTGEKIYESHISEAVNKAVDSTGVLVDFFAASIQMDRPNRYIFLVEFNQNPSAEKKRDFLREAEKELCRQNSEYEDIRQQELLAPPILKVVKRGEFEKYRSKMISEGRHDGQFKVSQLEARPDFQKHFIIEEEIVY